MRLQILVAEALAVHDAGAEVLDEDVGVAHQAADELDAARLADVDADAALVAVEALEVGAADVRRQAAGAVGVADRVAAAGLLDLDHVGAHVAEQGRAPRPGGLVRHVDDADAGERASGGCGHVDCATNPEAEGSTTGRGPARGSTGECGRVSAAGFGRRVGAGIGRLDGGQNAHALLHRILPFALSGDQGKRIWTSFVPLGPHVTHEFARPPVRQ